MIGTEKEMLKTELYFYWRFTGKESTVFAVND
jgi:hypothetical protein